jgi:putative N6-adenine-specific DNA methylase
MTTITSVFRMPSWIVLVVMLWLPSTLSFVFNPPIIRSQDISLSATSDSSLPLPTPASTYIATCIPGLAHVLAEELQEIHHDITDVSVSGNSAVTFVATREASLHALCWVRTAHRLLEMIASSEFDLLYDRNDLHAFVKQAVDVKSLLGDGQGGLLTLSVKTILNKPGQLPQDLSHSHYTALTIKNALCDVVRDLRGDRPSVDVDDPDVPLVAILLGSEGGAVVTLYRSLHPPGSLHKRGYRSGDAIHKAAMKESLAAGLLREAGWHRRLESAKNNESERLRLVDPMAGSGSFLLEAAMMAADISPGLMRIRCKVPGQSLPPVTRWKSDIDVEKMWKGVVLEASQRAKNGLQWIRSDPSKIHLLANDIHPGALDILDQSLFSAGLQSLVEVTNMDCYDLKMTEDIPHLIVTNPPWGVRLTEDVEESWEGLRHFIRDACPAGTEAWILSGHKGATGQLKLRRDRMIPIQTGEQTLRWIQYTIRAPREVKAEEGKDDPRGHRKPKEKRSVKVKNFAEAANKPRKAATAVKSGGKKPANEWLVD